MSKIAEIRKRINSPWDSPEAPTHYQAVMDAKALLAALDGEWQSERPTEGKWYLSNRPDLRGIAHAVIKVRVSGDVVKFRDGSKSSLSHSQFIGALWQRRTVPRDPFNGGGV